MPDIFISYGRDDAPVARRAAQALEALGYDIWWDDELLPHRPFGEVIEEQINAAKVVLVLWSARSVTSQWVRAEAEAGRVQRKLVQAVIDSAQPPMPFNQFQTADLRDWHGASDHPAWLKLLAAIQAFSGREPILPQPAKPASRHAGRARTWGLVAAGACLVIAAGVWFGVDLNRQASAWKEPLTSVSPFTAASDDAAARAFAAAADGDISGALTENQILTVPPARAGKATFVISGAVDGSTGRLHARVRLTERKSGAELWSAEFDRGADDPQGLRGQINRSVSDIMLSAIEGTRKSRGKISPANLALWVQAREAFAASLDRSRPLLEQLVIKAPGFALGRASLCNHLIGAAADRPETEFLALRARGLAECEAALRIDPHEAIAYQGRAFAEAGDAWALREGHVRKGQAMDPGPLSDVLMTTFLMSAGRQDEGLGLMRQAIAVRKTRTATVLSLAMSLYMAGRTEEAVEFLDRQLALKPDDLELRSLALRIVEFDSDPGVGQAILDDAARRPTFGAGGQQIHRVFLKARSTGSAADIEAAEGIILASVAARNMNQGDAIPMLAKLGRLDAAFALAQAYADDPRVRRSGFSMQPLFLFEPPTAAMRADARFIPIVEQLGLVNFWKAGGHWPDFCEHEPASVCGALKGSGAV